MASVGRYYRRRARERQVSELLDAQEEAWELNELPVDVASLREAAVKLAGKSALKLAGEKPHDMDHLVAFTRLLLESEENEIRRGRLKLAQQQFDYEAMAASIAELPQFRAHLIKVSEDDSLTEMEKLERVRAIMFGKDDPEKITNGTMAVQPFSQAIKELHPEKCVK